jgi:hypothetical protein
VDRSLASPQYQVAKAKGILGSVSVRLTAPPVRSAQSEFPVSVRLANVQAFQHIGPYRGALSMCFAPRCKLRWSLAT